MISEDIKTIESIKQEMTFIDTRKKHFDIKNPNVSMIILWIPITYYNFENFEFLNQNNLLINSFFAFLSFYLFISFIKEKIIFRKNIKTFFKKEIPLKIISELLVKYDYSLKLKYKASVSNYDHNLNIIKKLLNNLKCADSIIEKDKINEENLIEND